MYSFLQTLLRQETVVTVQGVPLTSYMEGIIGELPPFFAVMAVMVKLFLCSQCCGSESRFGSASSIQSAWVPWSVVWIGSPHPLHRKRLCPSQDPSGGEEGGHKLAFGRGGWGSQYRRRDRHFGTVLCILIPSLWDSKFLNSISRGFWWPLNGINYSFWVLIAQHCL